MIDFGKPRLSDMIAELADGDIEALGDIYEATRRDVFGFALSILRNPSDAEDVTHDVYVAIATSAGSYVAKDKPMAWILTITKNLAYTQLRKKRDVSVDVTDEVWERYHPRGSESGMSILTAEDRVVLQQYMSQLSDEERRIVMLHAVSGFKHREIAELLEMPTATVLSKYNRAMKKLRAALTDTI